MPAEACSPEQHKGIRRLLRLRASRTRTRQDCKQHRFWTGTSSNRGSASLKDNRTVSPDAPGPRTTGRGNRNDALVRAIPPRRNSSFGAYPALRLQEQGHARPSSSFSDLDGLKRTVFDAAIVIVSPVAGFRPCRSARSET